MQHLFWDRGSINFPQWINQKPRDLPENKKSFVQLQTLTNFTILKPLFIYLAGYLTLRLLKPTD